MSQLLRDLAELSSAEDFFAYFDLTFDPKVRADGRRIRRFVECASLEDCGA